MSTSPQRPEPSNALKGRDLGDEYLFYDHAGDQVHVLNSSARELYLLCNGKRTRDQVIQAFADCYEQAREARQDAAEILTRLLDLGLLHLS